MFENTSERFRSGVLGVSKPKENDAAKEDEVDAEEDEDGVYTYSSSVLIYDISALHMFIDCNTCVLSSSNRILQRASLFQRDVAGVLQGADTLCHHILATPSLSGGSRLVANVGEVGGRCCMLLLVVDISESPEHA